MAPTLSSPSFTNQQHVSPIPSTSNSAPAPSATRIRENQRRSRARRKEYLQELEQKLRKCEQAGISASVDIQLAARGVAEQNKRLRAENGRLREEGEGLRLENERMRARLEANRQERVKALSGGGYGDGLSSCGTEDAEPEASSASQLQYPTMRQVAEPSTSIIEGGEIYNAQQLTPTQPDSRSAEVSCTRQNGEMMVLGDDTSSCEYAAHIITSMRADVSTDDVRADLGCGGDVGEWRKCTVNNSKLFVAVDRYTG